MTNEIYIMYDIETVDVTEPSWIQQKSLMLIFSSFSVNQLKI